MGKSVFGRFKNFSHRLNGVFFVVACHFDLDGSAEGGGEQKQTKDAPRVGDFLIALDLDG